jgi:Secretion system C-terminal sorting domain
MKTIHYSFLMCALLFLTEYMQAQTPVNWSAARNASYVLNYNGNIGVTEFKAISSASATVIGTNSIAPNTNGWVKFTLRAAVGNCFVAFGLGDKNNGTNQTFGNAYVMTAYNGGVVHSYGADNSWSAISGCGNWVNNGDANGTIIKIERVGSTINYYHNGVLLCTKTNVGTAIELIPVVTVYDGYANRPVLASTEISQPGVGIAVPAVEYTYDETGNRIRRKTVTVVLPRSSKQEEEITFSDFKLKVFPNPSDGHFEVTVEGDTEGLSFDVFDMAGKHLHKEPVAGMNTSINVSHLSTGMYILTCRDAQKIKGQWKLMIQ